VCVWISAADEFDQLTALSFRHPANRFRGRDPAAAEKASDPRRTDLWHREQEILNLGRLRVGGRLRENIGDPHSPGGEFPLQGRSAAADLIRLPQGPQPLIEGLRRSSLAPPARHRGILGNPRLAERLTAACGRVLREIEEPGCVIRPEPPSDSPTLHMSRYRQMFCAGCHVGWPLS
jgi:hypothetical protein